MTNAITGGTSALIPPAPSTPCVPQELILAMADRAFVFDSSPVWSPEHAVTVLEAKGATASLMAEVSRIKASTAPVPRGWLADRLTALWTMFMASRREANSGSVTIWLAEYIRLLDDLPWDIVGLAIDDAVRTSKHGFLPAVGEIRAIADPLVQDRRHLLERMMAVADHLRFTGRAEHQPG